MFAVVVFHSDNKDYIARGVLPSSGPSTPDFKVAIDSLARTHAGLPSSTSWDVCYVEQASFEDLCVWAPVDAALTPANTPVFRVARDEEQAMRARSRKASLKETRSMLQETRNMLKETRNIVAQLETFRQAHIEAIDAELRRLISKRPKFQRILEYEVFNGILSAIDDESRHQYLTDKEIETLKAADFNWFGYFIDIETKHTGVAPHIHHLARKVLHDVGPQTITQFAECRRLMDHLGKEGRHAEQRPQPSLDVARNIIQSTAARSLTLDAVWLKDVAERSFSPMDTEWEQRDDIENQIHNLEVERIKTVAHLL
ncbi:hypothetical protein C8R47DRAFT_1326826 [Mycena vitilis]|nr:hypothetical protein C8R47DRAFT_1326826 [Mycena vitilis]